jgi:hypothetical protein
LVDDLGSSLIEFTLLRYRPWPFATSKANRRKPLLFV